MGVDEQIESYKRQLYTYNAMVSEMVTSTAYSSEEIKEIWEDFYEYKVDVDLKIGKLENEKNYAVYEKWKSDAKNWKISAIHMMIGTKQATVIFSFTSAVSNVFRKCMTAVL